MRALSISLLGTPLTDGRSPLEGGRGGCLQTLRPYGRAGSGSRAY